MSATRLDPIYAAIDRERRAYAASHAPNQQDEEKEGALGEWFDAQDAFLRTRPASVAGLLVLLRHLGEHFGAGWDDKAAHTAFPTLGEAARWLSGGPIDEAGSPR
jgi:hypothetical protein